MRKDENESVKSAKRYNTVCSTVVGELFDDRGTSRVRIYMLSEFYFTSGGHVTTIAKRRKGRADLRKSTLLLSKVTQKEKRQGMGSALPRLPVQ